MSKRLPVVMGEGFLPLLHNRDPFVFLESPRGCLKTCTILNTLMMRANQWPGLRWYLWRSKRTRLSETVMRSLEDYIIPMWSRVKGFRLMNPNAEPSHRNTYQFENGTEFILQGLDDIQRGTSAEGAGGYLAEAIELDMPEQATALAGMLRQPGVPFHQIIVDTNPGAPGHWLNKIAEDAPPGIRKVSTRAEYDRLQGYNRKPAADPLRRWKRIILKIQDNPHFFDADKWELTEPGASYLRTLGTINGPLYRRWIEGEWVTPEGGVYPEFDIEIHQVDAFKIPADWPILCGWDPGYDHPCAWLWFTIAPNDNLYIIDEIVGSGIRLPELARRVLDTNAKQGWLPRRNLGDPQYILSEKQESDSAQYQMQQLGIFVECWPRTGDNMDAMVMAVRKRWIDRTLKVFPNCTATIEAIQGWQYKRLASGELPAGDKDRYDQKYKDVNDVIRGVVASNPTFESARVVIYDEEI